ncbi:MAG: FG-GAP-like repeat-containing protein, partial [Bacteroidota bacterium]
MKKFLLKKIQIGALLMFVCSNLFAQTPPNVTSFSPTRNNPSAPRSSNIQLTYNTAVTSTGTNQNNFFIHRSQKGRIGTAQGSYTGAGTNTTTYNPSQDFFPGELISVSRTKSVTAVSGSIQSISTQDYSFYAAAGTGPASFISNVSSPNVLNSNVIETYSADINNDNNIDLLTLTASRIRVMTGNGNGTLNTGTEIFLPLTVASCWAIADYDRDGDLDIAVGYNSGLVSSTATRLSVYLNNSLGGFGSPVNYTAPALVGSSTSFTNFNGITSIAAADYGDTYQPTILGADGDIDLMIGFRSGTQGWIAMAENNSFGGFGVGLSFLVLNNAVSSPLKIVTGDFNNNSVFDLAVLTSNNTIEVVERNGEIYASTLVTANNGATALDMIKGDFNNDGRLDLAYASNGFLYRLLNTTTGGFSFSTAAVAYSGNNCSDIEVADIDGDLDLDLLLAQNGGSSLIMRCFLNNGIGSFTNFTSFGSSDYNPAKIAAGDYDNDGDIDLGASRWLDESISILLNKENTITVTNTIGSICTQSSINVNYISSGTFNVGNVFIVQLSDQTGNFQTFQNIGTTTSSAGSGSISCNIPASTPAGSNYKLRIVSSSPATTGFESAAFTINTSPFISLQSRLCNSNVSTAITVTGASSYSWFPTDGLNNVNSASVIATPAAPTVYFVTGTLNGCTSTSSVSVSNTCYCVGAYSFDCSSNDYIESFNIGNIDNNLSGCNGHLGNYTSYLDTGSATTLLQAGSTYFLSATTGSYAQGIGVWIDINIDGDFDDAGELVFSGAPSTQINGSFVLPSNITEGQSVMRVRSIYNVTPAATDACNLQTYGEIEDYKVMLVNPLVVVSTLPLGNAMSVAVSSNTSVTFNSNISSTGATTIHGSSKGLYTSVDNINQPSVIFDPSQNYQPGEKISVTVPSATGVNNSTLTAPYQFEYYAASGSGTALFQSLNTVTSSDISDIVTGDFNNDGDADIAVARNLNAAGVSTLQIYSNNGSGNFVTTNSYSNFTDTRLAAGDLDNDGDIDLVTAVPFANNTMEFYRNDNGTFLQRVTGWVTESATNIAVADMTGDGNLDIVCSNPSTGRLFYYLNTGFGSVEQRFSQTPILIQFLSGINSFAIGDFNKDGLLDVASGASGSGFIRINYNLPGSPGSFSTANNVFLGSTSSQCTSIQAIDYDSDGDLDLVAAKSSDNTIIITKNNFPLTGAGSYSLLQTLSVGASPANIEPADYDGDGDIDLYVAHAATTATYIINNGTGYTVSSNNTGGNPSVVCSADFDEDGDIDVVGKSNSTPITFYQNQEYTVTATVNTNPACAGQSISIDRTLSPTVWPSTFFTAELSDASGSFTAPVTLGTITSTTGSVSSFIIPQNTPAGTAYRVRWINDLTGSTVVQSGAFTVNNLSLFNVSGGGTICSGATATINLSGSTSGVRYRLIRNGTNNIDSIVSLGGPISFTVNTAGTYTILARNLSTQCLAFMNGSATVITNPTPNIFNAFGGGSYCAGGSGVPISMSNSNSGITYQLLLGGVPTGVSINATGGPFTFPNVQAAGAYTVRAVNNITGCTSIMNNTVNVSIIPTITPSVTLTTSANPVCAGAALTISANPVNGGTPTYTWFVNAVNANASSTSGSFTTSTLNNGDVVSVSMSSSEVCASPNPVTANVTITVNPLVTPAITISTPQTTVCSGSNVTFNSTISNGGPNPQYQWQINGVNVSGANAPTFTTNSLTNGQVVRCRLISDASCTTQALIFSSAITMVVNPQITPSVSISASTLNICQGANVDFTSSIVNGGNNPQFQWIKNGVNILGANLSSYSTTGLSNSDQIKLMLTSNATCASSGPVYSSALIVNVTPTIVPTVTISASANPICLNDATEFTAVSTNAGASPVYTWRINGIPQQTGSSASFGVVNSAFSNGDIVSATVTSTEQCASPVTVSSNNITMTIYTPSIPVIVESPLGTLLSTPAITYQWFLNGINLNASLTSQSINISSSGNYVVRTTDINNCYYYSDIFSVATPVISVNPVSASICAGASFDLSYSVSNDFINPNLFRAQLSDASGNFGAPVDIGLVSAITGGVINVTIPNGTNSGVGYKIRVIADNPVSISTPTPSFTINALNTASVTINSTPSGVQCAGTIITFTASPQNGGTTPQYQWTVNGSPVNGANTPTFSTGSLNNNDLVKVILTSNLSCITGSPALSAGIQQSINPIIIPSVSISGNSIGCEGDLADFSSIVAGGGANPQYQWKVNGVNVAFANSAFYSTVDLNNNDVVSLEVTSNEVCASPSTVTSNEINYIENALPISYDLYGGGVICPNQGSSIITLDGSQLGVDYQLLSFGSPVGAPIAGTGNSIDIAVTDGGGYEVIATSAASCSSYMSGYVGVAVDPVPNEYILFGQSPLCPTFGTDITLIGSDFDFMYTLYFNGDPVSLTYDGDGLPILFGYFTDPGVYTVLAQYNSFGGGLLNNPNNNQMLGFTQGCETQLATSFVLSNSPEPAVFDLQGPTTICDGSSAIYSLSGSETGVTYSLAYSESIIETVQGTGSAIAFSPVNSAGFYTVTAILGDCQLMMNNEIALSITDGPQLFTLTGPSFLCEDAPTVITLTGSEVGVMYELYSNASPTGQSLVGTGSELDFTVENSAQYTVIATNASGCSATVGFLDIQGPSIITQFEVTGGGGICPDDDIGLPILLSGSESGVDYQVYLNGSPFAGPFAGTGSSLIFGNYTASGTYTVTAYDFINFSNNCETQMIGSAEIFENPATPEANAGSNQSICTDNTILSANQITGDNIGTWTILSGSASIADINDPNSPVSNLSVGNNIFVWTITSPFCPSDADTVMIVRNPLPIVSALTGGGSFCLGDNGVNITLGGSDIGTDYVLNANGIPIITASGTGTAIDFGLQTIAGNYSVLATDNATGCSSQSNNQVTVTVNPIPNAPAVLLTNNCGFSELAVINYFGSILWNDGSVLEVRTETSGTYQVQQIVNGCSSPLSAPAVVTPFEFPSITAIPSDAICDINNGFIDITVTGGTAPYIFAWNNGSNTEDITGLSAGNYELFVTDNNGCIAGTSLNINNIGGPSVSTTQVDATCGNSNGSIDLTVSGGTAPYIFAWNNGSNTEDITTLAAGTYNVTVADNNGCSVTTSVTVINNGGPSSINTLITDENCGNSDASIEITLVTGGVSPFEYAINALPYNSTPLFTGLSAGVNTIYVKDSFGCIYEQILVVGG